MCKYDITVTSKYLSRICHIIEIYRILAKEKEDFYSASFKKFILKFVLSLYERPSFLPFETLAYEHQFYFL